MCVYNPYDLWAREKYGDLRYADLESSYKSGSIERSQFILRTIGVAMPSKALRRAYFDNLRLVLKGRAKRAEPGTIVLGIGSGRSGSTTLTGAFASVPDTLSTHENPPMVFWEPLEAQLQMQFERFRLLAEYYPLVFEASHWWLNALPRFFAAFPTGKVIGMERDVEATTKSFMRIKGSGANTTNHWVPPGNGIWLTSAGDPVYPTYPVPEGAAQNPDAAKTALIRRYVSEYNEKMRAAASEFGERMLIVRTEEMSTPEAVARMSQFVGYQIKMPAALNVGTTDDSDKKELTF
jgi:hypothetical protein